MDDSLHARANLDITICESCRSAKGGAWVVQCDECDKWFHFNCVDFNQEEFGEDDPWSCDRCNNKKVVNGENSRADQAHGISVEPINPDPQISTSQGNANGSIGPRINTATQGQLQSQRSYVKENGLDKQMVSSFIRWQSRQNQTLPNANVRFSDTPIDLATSSLRNKANEQHISSLSEPKQTEYSTVNSGSQRIQETRQTENMEMDDEIQTLPSHQDQPIKGNASVQSANRQQNQVNKNGKSQRSDKEDVLSIKSRSTSSKRTVSSQIRLKLEEQRLQEQLYLQERLDEEKIALKLEALALKESRERKFLEEKFKAMDEECDDDGLSDDGASKTSKNSKNSHTPKQLNDTRHVLTWIEDQRKQKSKYTPMEVEDIYNPRRLEYSIDVSEREVREIVDKERKSMEVTGNSTLEQPMHSNHIIRVNML